MSNTYQSHAYVGFY